MENQILPLAVWDFKPRLQPKEATEAYEQIIQNVERAFNTKHEFLSNQGVDWSFIKTCLQISKHHFQELKLFWKTIYLLFEHFERMKNQELLPVVADILYFMVFEHFYGCFFLSIRDSPIQTSILSDEFDQTRHNVILKLMKRPYKRYNSFPMPEEDIVWISVKLDSERMLPILLRQGVLYIPPSSHARGWEYCKNVLNNICYLEDIFQKFDTDILAYKLRAKTSEKRQRLFTVFRAMDVVQHTVRCGKRMRVWLDSDTDPNFINRHRMIFDTIPEPIVTYTEVQRTLKNIFPPANRRAVISFLKRFRELMPETLAPLTPRSLYHLSRCQVRDVLRTKGQFPYGVYRLKIPNTVKQYLLLEDWFPSDAISTENDRLVYPDRSAERRGLIP